MGHLQLHLARAEPRGHALRVRRRRRKLVRAAPPGDGNVRVMSRSHRREARRSGRSSRGSRGPLARRSTIPGSASGTIPERTPTSSATRGWSSVPTQSARACRCICTRPGWTACGKSSPGCTAFPRSGSGTTTKGSVPTSR